MASWMHFEPLSTRRETHAPRFRCATGDSHPTIRELDGEIAAIRQWITDEVDALVSVAEDDLEEVQAIEAGLSRVQNEAQKAGLDLNLREIEYSRLSRQRESSSKLFDLLLQRTAETDLTRLLRTTYVRVVDSALIPKAPISPMVGLNLLGGVLGGLVFGFRPERFCCTKWTVGFATCPT